MKQNKGLLFRQINETGALREEHGKRVAEVTGQHDKIIQDTKERNFALVKKVEMLETSDLVKAIGKGARIPAEISQVCGVDGMGMWGLGCEGGRMAKVA